MSVKISRFYYNDLSRMVSPPEFARQLRRADDFIRLAVLAGYETIKEITAEESKAVDSYGLILGTAFGTMETNFEVLDQVVTEEPVSPILFSHSVFNAAAGYMATVFGIKGSVFTITDFSFPFFRALEQGYLAIISGRLNCCLVLQVETYSTLLLDAKKKYSSAGEKVWQPGVVCWLLENIGVAESSGYRIERLKIESISSPHDEAGGYLDFREQMTINDASFVCADPLATSTLLTNHLEDSSSVAGLDCRIAAQHGVVELNLQFH